MIRGCSKKKKAVNQHTNTLRLKGSVCVSVCVIEKPTGQGIYKLKQNVKQHADDMSNIRTHGWQQKTCFVTTEKPMDQLPAMIETYIKTANPIMSHK